MNPLFQHKPALIAMVHVGALPGTPYADLSVSALEARATGEARLLADLGVDGVLVENMHDRPYLNRKVCPEIVASMGAVLAAVREEVGVDMPLGVQILAGANKEALAVAHLAGGRFIRAEGFVFAHVADEGLMPEADAGELLRYRRRIGAHEIHILADVKKKHSSHAITADVDLGAAARAAEFFGADGLVVTGGETGLPTDPDHLRVAMENTTLPVFVGSGVTPQDLHEWGEHADGLIVGSYLKRDGKWFNPPDSARVTEMVQAVRRLRASSLA